MGERIANLTLGPAPYQYRPLAESDFTRILILHPSAQRGAPLRCDIIHCQNEDFEYEAISYAWGPPNFTASLLCGPDEDEIRITPSLDEALRAFRDSSAKRRLWADAVCINQGDLDEKIQQVRRMPQIYRQTTGVLVWLGGDYGGGEEILRLIKGHESHLLWMFQKVYRCESSETPGPPDRSEERTIQSIQRDFSRDNFVGLQRFISRPWFQRRWVIQEVALARKGTVSCGAVSMDAARFIKCADVLCFLCHEVAQFPVAAVRALENLVQLAIRPEGDQIYTLIPLLYLFHASECSDDRDRVYALMGLARRSASDQLTDKGQHGFPALGYRSGVEHVYQAVTLLALDEPENGLCVSLEVASCFPSRDVPDSKVPSWVPDWRAPKRSRRSLQSVAETRVHINAVDSSPAWESAGSILRVRGWSFGVVSSRVETPAKYVNSSFDKIKIWWMQYNVLLRGRTGGLSGENVSRTDDWSRFLHLATRGSFDVSDILPGTASGYLLPSETDWLLFKESLSPEEASILGASGNFTKLEKQDGNTDDPIRRKIVEDASKRTTQRRSLFELKSGLVVNGPDDAQAGDLVVILLDGPQFILRHTGEAAGTNSKDREAFQFIGDAAVEGLGKGTMLGEEELGEPRWFTIV